MKSFLIRASSAVVALTGLILIYKYFQGQGFVWLCLLSVLIAERELIRILFQVKDSNFVKALFFVCTLIIFSSTIYLYEYSSLIFACVACFYCSFGILRMGRKLEITHIAQVLAKSVMGFFYLGLLPAFACRLIYAPNGITWFFTMLAIVFSGDTLAYISGMLLGKNKLIPSISPKKTLEGAIGGLLGSCIAAAVASYFLPHVRLELLVLLGLTVGFFAQLGDFFESLLKRIANIKDSGSIMPGHGGVLDRLDGVLFAAPFMLLGATLLEKFSL